MAWVKSCTDGSGSGQISRAIRTVRLKPENCSREDHTPASPQLSLSVFFPFSQVCPVLLRILFPDILPWHVISVQIYWSCRWMKPGRVGKHKCNEKNDWVELLTHVLDDCGHCSRNARDCEDSLFFNFAFCVCFFGVGGGELYRFMLHWQLGLWELHMYNASSIPTKLLTSSSTLTSNLTQNLSGTAILC